MQQINMRQAHGRHACQACKIAITRQPTREWCCMKSCFSATNKEETGMAGAGSSQTPEALSERGAVLRPNPPTAEPATEETGSVGACKPLNPGATYANSTEPRKLRGRARNSGRRHATRGAARKLTHSQHPSHMLGTGEGRGGNTHYTGLRLNTWWADKTHSENAALKSRPTTTFCIQHNTEWPWELREK
ncbi:hypothetical protein E2C01_041920 [Portunus trituberculatus]|uniref:Uncharacterized protein n=1 Tax=Portunus trituberculatus TaxID=210409 RepID=A0A5B7FV12_PORTR|nr:hypothetical protein [Portunus trituberculatus]